MKKRRALIIVDMQNDFVHPAGALYVKDGEKVALAIEQLVKERSKDYDIIIATKDWHPKNHYSFEENGGRWPRHCVQGTWGACFLLGEWVTDCTELTIGKGMSSADRNDYSGFSGIVIGGPIDFINLNIVKIFEELGWVKDNIIIDVVGLALDYCVKVTAIDAAKLGFKIRILLKYTKAVNLKPGDDAKAIKEMERAGVAIVY